ncbi:MAG: restriction endonuclease subunit S [Candidatus Gracilibacteria bacterium]|nr:restriction endonuclease subunit S [Candidatus Gracilibacteria bacterium]
MRNKVKNIAVVQTGVFLRTGKKGSVTYLQAKHFNDYGELREKLIPDLKIEEMSEKHLLQNGDILFSAKGTRNFATVYRSEYGPCVASSTFLVIRLNSESNYIPEFVALILNNFKASQYFRENNLTGTTVQSISKKIIDDFEIGIIEIEKQKKLLHLHGLHKKQIEILENLMIKKDKLINSIILQYNNHDND